MRRFLLSLCLVLAVASACGGGSGGGGTSVGTDDAAVVGSTHITVQQVDDLIKVLKASAVANGQKVPQAGTAAYRTQVVQPVVDRLVLIAQIKNIADDMGLQASDQDIQKQIDDLVKQSYGGDKSKLQADLKKAGLSQDQYEQIFIVPSVLQTKIQDKLKSGQTPSDADLKAYYEKHKSDFVTPDTRTVEYILVGNQADAIKAHNAVKNGEDWDKVAKQYAIPPGPPQTGGTFKATAGQVETNFGAAVFGDLKTGSLSDLIEVSKSYEDSSLQGKCKPQCYFLVKPTEDVVHGGQQTFDEAKASISSTLSSQVDQKVSDKIKALVDAQKKSTHYNPAYAPSTAAAPGGSGGATT
jgi:hypothetical protein